MPYKDPADRNEAVRRYRVRKRSSQLLVEKGEKVDTSLASVLELIGFVEISFEDFIETCQGFEKDSQDVWHDRHRQNKIVFPPAQVFFGRNTLIAGTHLDDQINAFELLLHSIADYAESSDPEVD